MRFLTRSTRPPSQQTSARSLRAASLARGFLPGMKFLFSSHSFRYHLRMPDGDKLTPADPCDIATALALALTFFIACS
jgi:hypothetical protein